jgi:DNA-binding CsgD family transcriptional regulator
MSPDLDSAVLPRAIAAIGAGDFAAVTAQALLDSLAFDLAAVVVHGGNATLLFDNFTQAGAATGLANYLQVTRRCNPLLRGAGASSAYRAGDVRPGACTIDDACRPWLVESGDEELGYRTLGWPEKLEEVGLHLMTGHGLVEIGLYRERAASRLPAQRLRALARLGMPLAAAFERDRLLTAPATAPTGHSALSPRERDVVQLLLQGCGSEAIALRLGISRHTVKDHRKQIFRKLRVGTLAELFARYRAQR